LGYFKSYAEVQLVK